MHSTFFQGGCGFNPQLTAATDGQTGVSKHVGPNPKRLRLSSPLPHRASCIKTQVKRKTTTGVPVSSTDRLVAHVLAKRVRLAENLGEPLPARLASGELGRQVAVSLCSGPRSTRGL